MDGLSAAASGIAVFSIAIQLAESVKKLCDFWRSIKEAPDDIRAISIDLEILSKVLAQLAHESQSQEPDATLAAALQGCSIKVRTLDKIIDEIEPGFSSKSLRVRKWTALRAALKHGQVVKFQEALERLKSTLLIAQQNQSNYISRNRHISLEQNLICITQSVASLSLQQRSEIVPRLSAVASSIHLDQATGFTQRNQRCTSEYARDACHVPDRRSSRSGPWTRKRNSRKLKYLKDEEQTVFSCLLGTIRANSVGEVITYSECSEHEHETSYTICPAPWLIRLGIRCGLRLAFSFGSNGWRNTLQPLYLVPDDALIFKSCAQGNISAVKEILSGGLASVKDTDSAGYTPLHVAALYYHPELCRILKHAGADLCAQTYQISTAVVLTAEHSYPLPLAIFPDAIETFRVVFDSMDFFEEDGAGWKTIYLLLHNALVVKELKETKSRLSSKVSKPSSFEMKASKIRREEVRFWWWRVRFSRTAGSAELLSLGSDGVVDKLLDQTDRHNVLQGQVIDGDSGDKMSAVLLKGSDLHCTSFDANFSPFEESPTSLAMYHSAMLRHWLFGLLRHGVSLTEFVADELEQSSQLYPGWEDDTLLELFTHCVQDDDIFAVPPGWSPCRDCHEFREFFKVQPHWRHFLENFKTKPHPHDPVTLNCETLGEKGIEEDERENLGAAEGRMEITSSSLGQDAIERASCNESDDLLSVSGSELGPESGLITDSSFTYETDPHQYPPNVSVQSDCTYGRDETICMDCWLYYVRNGTRRSSPSYEEIDPDTRNLQSDEPSEDEFSPFHVHT